MDTPEARLTLLERMADQQLRLNDQLIEITARLTREQGLHAERMTRYEEILIHQDEHMAELRHILAAITDMLDRGNGH
jgi:hypothetical protein